MAKKKKEEPPVDLNGIRCMTLMEAAERYNRVTYHDAGKPLLFGPFSAQQMPPGRAPDAYIWTWKILHNTRVLTIDFVIDAVMVKPNFETDDYFIENRDRALATLMESIQ